MATTDHILFVKEAKTCSYVVVIHTPRLCGEPGFKSRRNSGEEQHIRCREVVESLPNPASDKRAVPRNLVSDQPFKTARRNTVLPPPQAKPNSKGQAASSADDKPSKEERYERLVQAILKGDTEGEEAMETLKQAIDEGKIVVEFVNDFDGKVLREETVTSEHSKRAIEALRALGYEVPSELGTTGRKAGKEGKEGGKDGSAKTNKDEKESSGSAPPKAKGGRVQKVLQEHLEL